MDVRLALTRVDSRPCTQHPRMVVVASNADSAAAGQSPATAETVTSDELNQWARDALKGESQAVRRFLHAITPQVRGICRGVMGRENHELEDAIQDCLIDVVRALPQFRFEADVSHYITKITLRRAIATRQRARARSKPMVALDPHELPSGTFDAGREARVDMVRNLLDDLNQSQTTVLRLRLMLGHSIDEIACMTGVSVNTVKTRLRLGKNQLRRWLERNGEAPRGRRR